MVNIRLARQEDLARLNSIYNWAVEHTVATFDLEPRSWDQALAWYNLHQDPYYPLCVLETKAEIAGWGSISPFHPRPAYRRSGEFSVYVAPDFQHKGFGNILLGWLCREAEKLGYHTLLGLITASNKASLQLAAKHGFAQVGYYREVGCKFGSWQDVIVVQRLFEKT